jgi:hypothetical protein
LKNLARCSLVLACLWAFAGPADAAPSPAPSPSPSIDLDLDELNKALGLDAAAAPTPAPAPAAMPAIGGRMFQSMNPDISLILDGAAAYFSDANPLQSGGHDPRKNGFNLQQLELSLNSYVDPYFMFNSNIVFAQFGVEIEEAYGTTTALPLNLQARAGQFLTRFGRLNASHPHTWEFVDQPFILGKFMGGEGNRGLGAEVSWLTPLPWYTEWIGSLTEAQGQATARSFYGATDLGVKSPLDLQATTSLQQFFPLARDVSLNWGLSAASGPNPSGRANRSELFGTDLYLRYRPLEAGSFTIVTWTTELMGRRRQVPGDLLFDYGGYSSLFWKIDQVWGTAARYEYGSGLANDPLDPDWTRERQRVTVDLTFWPTEFQRWRLQQSVDLPGWRPAPVYATMLTYEFVTGAHGAHKF